jgi:peptidoglycan/xylan/chitin deacetylase (PgdA/CDA1 family)
MMQFPVFLRPLFGKLTWRIKTKSRVIYLTFDDGPVPEVTPQVLDILDLYGWKATFFCVGENVRKYPELYQEIIRRGHRVGNHSYHHIRGFRCSVQEYVANVKKASELIESKLFRPPHGRIKFSQIKALKSDYQIVMWDVISYDYDRRISPETIFNIIKRNLRKGSIVVFHDSIKAEKNVLTVLPKALAYWKEHEYHYDLL